MGVMERMGRYALAVLGASATCAGALPAVASAETSCAFSPSSGVLQVDATTNTRVRPFDDGRVVVYDYRIVFPGRPPGFDYVPISCSDADTPGAMASPTTTTVGTLDVRATSLAYDPIVPGSTSAGEGPTPEVEVSFNGTTLSIGGSPEADGAVFGVDAEAGGIAANLNAGAEPAGTADTDVVAPNLTALFYNGAGGGDAIDGRGGGPIEGPLPATVAANYDGGTGTDVIDAGLGPTTLTAGFDFSDDQLHGGPADDVLNPSGGNGDLIGGGGTDELRVLGLPGVTIDLRITEPQQTGRGTKLIREVEDVIGTLGSDTLIGDAGPNVLNGFDERDVIDGGPGDDHAQGGLGRDLITGGDGADHVDGGLDDDRVDGGPGDDSVRGAGGLDRLFGAQGSDFLLAYDRKPFVGKLKGDRLIDCGPGRDQAAHVDKADPEPRSC
jgi:hypothetical protein